MNPFTGEVAAQCPDATRDQLNEAVAAAKGAFPAWSKTPIATRRALLVKACAELQRRGEQVAQVLVMEQGKPISEARAEVAGAIHWMTNLAKMEMPATEIIQDDKTGIKRVEYIPLGVVAGITPWNFPLMMATWKIAPALFTGNTFVLKPSPYTPLCSLLIGDIFGPIFPPGVINVVSGGNDLGAWLTQHKDIAKISFTGSVPTGKAIQAVCADDLKHVTLELGGNDAAIIMPDADVSKVAKEVFAAAFSNCGQVCCAVKRVYVPESMHDALANELVTLATNIKIGNGKDANTEIGPLQNEMQLNKVSSMVEDARKSGGNIRVGGKRISAKGYLYEPTIITDVDESFRIVSEEQFGPVLPLIRYKTVDDAVLRANDCVFGLGASVWGSDIEKAADVAGQLHAGTVWVNQHAALSPEVPFGGAKWSGVGREGGKWGMMHFLEPRVINISKL